MKKVDVKAGAVLTGPLFPEPIQVVLVQEFGASIKLLGKGLRSELWTFDHAGKLNGRFNGRGAR